MPRVLRTLGLLGAGAVLMYFLDPVSGIRRRGVVMDRWLHWGVRARSRMERSRWHQSRYERHTRSIFGEEIQPVLGDFDAGLHARVRTALRRLTRSPLAIQVKVSQGVVTLSGEIPGNEHQRIVENVSALPGVVSVEDQLQLRKPARRWWPIIAVMIGAGGSSEAEA